MATMLDLDAQLSLLQYPRYFQHLLERLPVRHEIQAMVAMMSLISTIDLCEAA